METLFSLPLLGIIISIAAYEVGLYIYRKTKISLLNPLLIAIILSIAFLLLFDIDVEDYNKGGSFISFFLGPATVILAVPLYKQFHLLKDNFISILTGITVGTTISIVSVWILGRLSGLDDIIVVSMIPKSVTTPIGIEISQHIGGIQSITVIAIIMTGICGAVLGPAILKLLKIKSEVAAGVAMGTSSHALGTTKAIEMGEKQGAMSSLSIGLAGVVTVILVPLLLKFFN